MAQSSGVVKTYKLDASSEGCTGRRHPLTPRHSCLAHATLCSPGLFYRKRNAPGSFSTDGDKNWPRNGWTFKARASTCVEWCPLD